MSPDNDAEFPPDEPPLVVRPVARPHGPRPGIGEAVLWCLAFVLVLNGGAALFAALAWGVIGLASGDIGAFAQDEMRGLRAFAGARVDGRTPVLPAGVSAALAWGMLLGQAVAVLFVWLLLRSRTGRDWRRQVALRRPRAVHVMLALIVLPGLMLLHGAAHELIHAAFGQKPSSDMGEALKGVFAPWPWPLAVFVVGVLPGFLEELFCRGFLGRGLVARYGFVTGILLTSMLFGWLHVLPLYALGTMVMGIALHFTYVMSRSLWVPILIHTVNNSVTILATTGVIDAKALDQNAAGQGALVYLAALVAVGFGFFALWTARTRLEPMDPAQPAWRPAFPGVEVPPAGANARFTHSPPNLAAVLLALAATGALLFLLFR